MKLPKCGGMALSSPGTQGRWLHEASFVSGWQQSFGLTNGDQFYTGLWYTPCYCLLAHVQIWIQQNLTDRCGLSQYKLRNGAASLLKGNNQAFSVSRLAHLSEGLAQTATIVGETSLMHQMKKKTIQCTTRETYFRHMTWTSYCNCVF